jgi:hypothetical protein
MVQGVKLDSKNSCYKGMDWQSKQHPFTIAPNDIKSGSIGIIQISILSLCVKSALCG